MKNDLIKQLRKNLNLTQLDVSKFVGVSKTSVSQWESGLTSPRGEHLYTLCKVLQCEPDYLLYGKDVLQKSHEPSPSRHNLIPNPYAIKKVPLISLVQAGEWTSIADRIHTNESEEWQDTTASVSTNAFALRVRGDSMVNPHGFPSIPEGSIVIVDPDGHVESGKIVVVRLDGTSEATLKKLIIDGPYMYLKPLNPDYRTIQIDQECTIVGIIKQVISDL